MDGLRSGSIPEEMERKFGGCEDFNTVRSLFILLPVSEYVNMLKKAFALE